MTAPQHLYGFPYHDKRLHLPFFHHSKARCLIVSHYRGILCGQQRQTPLGLGPAEVGMEVPALALACQKRQ